MKTIVFDFGNVIAFFDHSRALNQLTAFTPLTAVELHRILYNSPLEDAYEHGFLSTEEYVHEALQRGRITCSSSQFLSAFVDIFTPNPDVISCIPECAKQYRLILASNTNRAHYATYCVQFADALKPFSAIVTSFDAASRKPASVYFQYVQKFTQASPGECLFIDDLRENVEAAEIHGWQAVHYVKGDRLADKLQDRGIRIASAVS